MDASVSKAVDAYSDNLVARTIAASSSKTGPEEIDIDDLFDQLENEEDGSLRERRIAQLQKEYTSPAIVLTIRFNDIKELKDKEHGFYTEIKDEKAVLDLTMYDPSYFVRV
jgi:hypothetical protein